MRSRMTPDATTHRARLAILWLALILFGLLPTYAHATVSVSVSASPSGTLCPGTAVTLTATGTPSGCEGTPGSPTYQWSVGGSTVSGATHQTFATSAPASGTVQISCVVSFGACGSGTGSYNLTTNSSTITCNSISGPSSGTVCASYSFTANATGGCGGGMITYAWTVDGAAQSATGATLGPISLTAATHTISVTAHDSSGTSAPQSKTVMVGAAPGLSFTSGPSANPAAPTTCQTSVTLSASATSGCSGGTISYKWHFDDGSSDQTTSNTSLTHAFTTVKTYNVTVTASDGTNTLAKPLSLPVTQGAVLQEATPTASKQSPTTCDQVTFTAHATPGCTGNVTSYAWTVDGAAQSATGATLGPISLGVGSHTVSVTAKDSNGATAASSSPLSLTVTQGAVLKVTSVTASKQSPTTCDQVTFTATTSPGCTGNVTGYAWTVDGAAQSATGATLGPISLGAGQHTVSVTVKDSNNATASGSLSSPLTVTSATPAAPSNLAAAAVSPTQINLTWTAPSSGIAPSTYNIYRSTTPPTGGSGFTLITSTGGTSFQDTSVQASTPAQSMSYCYYVTGESVCQQEGGASNTACATTPCNDTITVQTPTASPSVAWIGQTVSFTASATSSCQSNLTYTWNFGDPNSSENTATGNPASHVYSAGPNDPTTYTVTVTVSDGNSAKDQSKTTTVTVNSGSGNYGGPGDAPVSCSCQDIGNTSPNMGKGVVSTLDPVATRGFPLQYDVNIQTSSDETTRPTANGVFTYDIRVGTQTICTGPGTSVTDWLLVDGSGRRLNFGPATGSPTAPAGTFGQLQVTHGTGGAVTGYQLVGAGEPDDLRDAGDFTYSFNSFGQLAQITDPQGNPQTLSYTTVNGQSMLQSVLDVNTGKSITLQYSNGQVSQIVQNGGQETVSLGYTGGLLSSVAILNSQGTRLTYKTLSYNSDGTIASFTRDGDPTSQVSYGYQRLPNKCGSTMPVVNNASTASGAIGIAYGRPTAPGAADSVYKTNAVGGLIRYDYDAQANLIATVGPTLTGATAPQTQNYGYDGNRNETSWSDNDTHGTTAYTSLGLASGETDALKNTWSQTFNGVDPTSTQNPVEAAAGVSDTIAYADPALPHVPTSATDSAGNTWSFTHNPYGQIRTVTPPPGSPMSPSMTVYDEVIGSATLGYPKSDTDGNGNLTSYDAYDALGDLLQVSTYPVAGNTAVKNTTQYTYDAYQRVTAVTRADNQSFQSVYVGDDLDHTIDEAGTQYNYSYCAACGALTGISGPLSWSLNWVFDGDHNLTQFSDANQNTTQYLYGLGDELTQVIYPDNSSLSYLYDNAGQVRQMTNGRGDNIVMSYDADERLHQVTFPAGGQAPITYDYNADGTVKDFTDGVGTTTYSYFVNGWLQSVQYNYSASGLPNVQELDYAYFPDGSRQSLTWKNGTSTVGTWTYGYDAGGRLTSVLNPWNETTGWAYDGEDKLTSQSNANGTATSYAYNQATAWVTSIAQTLGGSASASYLLAYDNGANTVGQLTGVLQSDGSTSYYGYDALYRLTSETSLPGIAVANPSFETPSAAGASGGYLFDPTNAGWTFSGIPGNGSGVTTNAGSNLTTGDPSSPFGLQVGFLQEYGSMSQNLSGFQGGVSYTLTITAAQRAGSKGGQTFRVLLDSNVLATVTPANNSYTDYSVGPFTAAAGAHTLSLVGTDPQGGDHTAFIDNVRLSAAPNSSTPVTHSYGYDLPGNRTSYDSLTIGYDAANKMATSSGNSSNPFSYDGDGNTTQEQLYSNNSFDASSPGWDDLNRMTSFNYADGLPWSLAYDASGLCVAFSPPGHSSTLYATFRIYDGSTVLGDINVNQPGGTNPPPATVNLQDAYTWGASGLVSERLFNVNNSGTNKSLWYHFGPQGETRQLTDSTGAVADSYGYTAYGVPTGVTGSDANSYLFGGQYGYYTFPVHNLMLCGLRWYDPYLGRFLCRDPIGHSGGADLYGYCGDDPVNAADPSGLYPGTGDPRELHTPTGLPGNMKQCGKQVNIGGVDMLVPPSADLDWNIKAAQKFGRRHSEIWQRRGALAGETNSGHSMDYKQCGLKHPDVYPPGVGLIDGLDAFGNFNYGAVGAALGLSDSEIQHGALGARAYQWANGNGPLIDDPKSSIQIQAGIDYYKRNYHTGFQYVFNY